VTGRLLVVVTGRLLTESADGVAVRKAAGTACSSLRFAGWGVLCSEAVWSQRVDPAGSHLRPRRSSPITRYALQWTIQYSNKFSSSSLSYIALNEQSVLVSGLHLGLMTRFLLLSDICGVHIVGRLPWRDDGYVMYSYNSLSVSGPSPAELMITS
jgi:hypothetical protein